MIRPESPLIPHKCHVCGENWTDNEMCQQCDALLEEGGN